MNLIDILDGTPEPPIIELQLDRLNKSGIYDLATPVFEFQKELTDQIVSLHYSDILKYCETDDNKELLKESLEICINNCMHVSTHPYLLINHYMPKNLTQRDLPAKLSETSGKFEVLLNLIDVIIKTNPKQRKNIGIVMNNHIKYFDLVEALLLGTSGSRMIKRYVGNSLKKDLSKNQKNSDLNKNSTILHLLPFDGKFSRDEDISDIKFDLVIVLDSWVDCKHEFFTKVVNQNRRNPTIVVRLVPMKTVEHCKLFYENTKHDKFYLYNIISGVVCLREQIGILPPDICPIYNQRLEYLSLKFFANVFKTGNRSSSYPAWPLPELPHIRTFTPSDVERSLLTEVHYHYTPYDSSEFQDSKKGQVKTETYYGMKRLQSDYIANSLKNDYRELIGIHGNDRDIDSGNSKVILSHLTLSQLTSAREKWGNIMDERMSYLKHKEFLEKNIKTTRSLEETRNIMTKFIDDVDHIETRISIADKKTSQRQEKIEEVRLKISEIEDELKNFIEKNNVNDILLTKLIQNQLRIWQLNTSLEENTKKKELKKEEETYMKRELENADNSIKESNGLIDSSKESHKESERMLQTHKPIDAEFLEYKKRRLSFDKRILDERKEIESMSTTIEHAFKFLRDTSSYKKRKSRGLTPNAK